MYQYVSSQKHNLSPKYRILEHRNTPKFRWYRLHKGQQIYTACWMKSMKVSMKKIGVQY